MLNNEVRVQEMFLYHVSFLSVTMDVLRGNLVGYLVKFNCS
jgi:hypothetical protein